MTIVTLLTDFGGRDAFVGVMKGVILARCPDARLVDLAHDLDPGDRRGAALQLQAALPYFPAGTVHVVVVDPGVGTERAVLAARRGEQRILAPDNGLLTPLRGTLEEVRRVERPDLVRAEPSATFHGRDVFAPLGAALAGGVPLGELGPVAEPVADAAVWPAPRWDQAGAHGEVLHADRFGNLITNLARREVQVMPGTSVWLGDQDLGPVRRTYADGRPGAAVPLWNSWDLLEIACRDGSAAERFGLGRGAPVELRAALRRDPQNRK